MYVCLYAHINTHALLFHKQIELERETSKALLDEEAKAREVLGDFPDKW